MAKRRFEFFGADEKRGTKDSAKFWTINIVKNSVTVEYGRIGGSTQSKVTEFETKELARAKAEGLIREKLRRGYEEIAPERQPIASKVSTRRGNGKDIGLGGNTLDRLIPFLLEAVSNELDKEYFYPGDSVARAFHLHFKNGLGVIVHPMGLGEYRPEGENPAFGVTVALSSGEEFALPVGLAPKRWAWDKGASGWVAANFTEFEVMAQILRFGELAEIQLPWKNIVRWVLELDLAEDFAGEPEIDEWEWDSDERERLEVIWRLMRSTEMQFENVTVRATEEANFNSMADYSRLTTFLDELAGSGWVVGESCCSSCDSDYFWSNHADGPNGYKPVILWFNEQWGTNARFSPNGRLDPSFEPVKVFASSSDKKRLGYLALKHGFTPDWPDCFGWASDSQSPTA